MEQREAIQRLSSVYGCTEKEIYIPQYLLIRNQWVLWKLEERSGKKTKVPYQPNGYKAKPNDSNTWSGYDAVIETLHLNRDKYSGIGFVLTDHDDLVFIDIDHCIDENGNISETAADVLEALPGQYTELSQSGSGIHILSLGKIPRAIKKKIEMYSTGRYIACTFKPYREPAEPQPAQQAITYLWNKYSATGATEKSQEQQQYKAANHPALSLSDAELIQKAQSARNGSIFCELYYQGSLSRYADDHSGADQALCNMLAFWTGKDPERMDRLFRNSALYRDKWDESHSYEGMTYGTMTIQNAIDHCSEVYEGSQYGQEMPAYLPDPEDRDPLEGYQLQPKEQHEDLTLIKASQIEETEIEWLIPGYIVKDTINFIFGDGGSGKTSVWCAIAAAISAGKGCFLEGLQPLALNRKPETVICFSSEDQVSKSLHKRWRLSGADQDNILTMELSNKQFSKIKFDSEYLEKLIKKYKPVLAVFDPIQSFIPADVNMSSRNEMRQCVQVLVGLGEKYHCTFLIIAHSNKRSNTGGRNRMGESSDLWDIARNVLAVGSVPDSDGIRYISQEKISDSVPSDTILFKISDSVPYYHATSKYKDAYYQNMKQSPGGSKPAPKADEAEETIIEFLKSGEWFLVEDLNAYLKANSISGRTAERARAKLKSEHRTELKTDGGAKGKWYIRYVTELEEGTEFPM